MSYSLENNEKVTVLALGDSLTAGYGLKPGVSLPDVLREMLAENGYPVEMVNAGVSGDTAQGGLARLDALMRGNYDAAIVEFGTNDAFMAIDPGVVRDALERIILRLQGSGAEVLLAGARDLEAHDPDYAARFNAVYGALAEKHELILHPFVLEGAWGEPGMTLWDGLHPNEEGVRAMARNMLPRVLELVQRARKRKRKGAR